MTALNDTTGQPHGVELTLSAQTNSSGSPPSSEGAKLLQDHISSTDSFWSVDSDGLVPGAYRVYIYAPSNTFVSSGDVIVGSSGAVSNLPGDAVGNLVEGVSWPSVDIETTDGTLSLSSICVGTTCGLAGMQLEYLPEPRAASGWAAGIVMLFALARRRAKLSPLAGRRRALQNSNQAEAEEAVGNLAS